MNEIITISIECCMNCRHYRTNPNEQVQRGGQPTGVCKRNPPTVVTTPVPNESYNPDPKVTSPRSKVPFGVQIIAAYPTMDGNDGCGEFRSRVLI